MVIFMVDFILLHIWIACVISLVIYKLKTIKHDVFSREKLILLAARRPTIFNMLIFVYCYLIFWAMTLPVHEFGHLLVLIMFGGDGYIKLLPSGAAVFPTVLPVGGYWKIIVVALMGGLSVTILYLLLALRPGQDIDDKFALMTNAVAQGVYGFCEMLAFAGFDWIYDYLMYISTFGTILSFTFFTYLYVRKLRERWFK